MTPRPQPDGALRDATQGFFAVRQTNVFDADGNMLGEGDHIVVNGGILQMACVTKQHIDAAHPRLFRLRTPDGRVRSGRDAA